jgi:hypothetical protein
LLRWYLLESFDTLFELKLGAVGGHSNLK